MIKIENLVVPSPEQMKFVIQGMRNPLNSWHLSDSDFGSEPVIGEKDRNLMKSLNLAGTEHRKFMRMMPVSMRITAPLYWFKEFETYKVGTTSNSCSTMHKITAKEFTLEDFSHEHLNLGSLNILKSTITHLNFMREVYLYGHNEMGDAIEPKNKDIWWQIIQLLPSSYNQTRNIAMNYEVLYNMYHQRRHHKLDEWAEFCEYLEKIPYSELITGDFKEKVAD